MTRVCGDCSFASESARLRDFEIALNLYISPVRCRHQTNWHDRHLVQGVKYFLQVHRARFEK